MAKANGRATLVGVWVVVLLAGASGVFGYGRMTARVDAIESREATAHEWRVRMEDKVDSILERLP